MAFWSSIVTLSGLQLVDLVDDGLEFAAEFGERGTRGVETGLLGLGGLEELREELVLRALAALEELVAVHHGLALEIKHVHRAKLRAVGLVVPVVGIEVRLLERGRVILEDVLHVGRVDQAGFDRRVVLLDLERSVFRRIGLFDGLGNLDQVVFLHPIAVSQLRTLVVELQFEIKCRGGEHQKHVNENVQKFIHSL